eukprot:4921705-Pleurochrysis_carterae.AAC.1
MSAHRLTALTPTPRRLENAKLSLRIGASSVIAEAVVLVPVPFPGKITFAVPTSLLEPRSGKSPLICQKMQKAIMATPMVTETPAART